MNEFLVYDSSSFVPETYEFSYYDFKKSLGVKSLFIDVSLDTFIDIWTNELFPKGDIIQRIDKIYVRKDFPLVSCESFSIFGQQFYKVDDVASGSPLGSVLANAFYFTLKNNDNDKSFVIFVKKSNKSLRVRRSRNLYGRARVSENPYPPILYAVNLVL